MTNWNSPAELTKDSEIYGKWVLATAGVAAWDVLSTLPFDWTIISGQRKWRWPMAVYFVCRICMILHIFAYAVNLNAISQIPCQQVVWISKVTDAIGTPAASLILILRTSAVWGHARKIWVPLGVMGLAQFILWCQTFKYSKSVWSAQRHSCQVVATAPNALIVSVFTFTMFFDLVILFLCSWKLWYARTQSGISSLLFRDGIIYFLAAFGANFLEMILAALRLNPVMNIMALPFALVVSVIAATSVFRNVFIMYDNFSAGTSGSHTHSASMGQVQHINGNRVAVSRGRGFSISKTAKPIQQDSFALGQMRSGSNLGGIEVTRVVDVERDGESTVRLPPTFSTSEFSRKQGGVDAIDEEDSDDQWNDRESKKSHLPL